MDSHDLAAESATAQRLANQCAGFKPPPGTPRADTKQSTVAEVQKQACGALFNLSLVAENKVKISNLGASDQVRRAMAAANATEDTKKWGQWLLDRLAQC